MPLLPPREELRRRQHLKHVVAHLVVRDEERVVPGRDRGVEPVPVVVASRGRREQLPRALPPVDDLFGPVVIGGAAFDASDVEEVDGDRGPGARREERREVRVHSRGVDGSVGGLGRFRLLGGVRVRVRFRRRRRVYVRFRFRFHRRRRRRVGVVVDAPPQRRAPARRGRRRARPQTIHDLLHLLKVKPRLAEVLVVHPDVRAVD
eukprot:31541-Pelagococcus_subviridis.AAC.5